MVIRKELYITTHFHYIPRNVLGITLIKSIVTLEPLRIYAYSPPYPFTLPFPNSISPRYPRRFSKKLSASKILPAAANIFLLPLLSAR